MARVVKVTLSAEVAQYASAMQEAADKTRAVGTEAQKAAQKREDFQKLGSVLLGVGGTMTALSLAVAKTGIEYNTLQQTSRAALTTLLGGAKEANAQMDKLDAFARTSPFSKATFITAQQQMLAFGVETKKVIPYLDAIQDAVAAAGGGNQELSEIAFIMAQISSAGKITAQDLMQFGQRGVNAAELIGSQMGKTGAEIRASITAGTLDADKALDALAGGMKQKFDGAAENVKKTFSGAMDRVKAAWRDLSADLTKPLVDPNGGGALVDFLNWTADIMRAFQKLPEPVKLTGGALFAFAGFVALASGAVIKLTPKVLEMRQSFMNLTGAMRGIGIAGGIAMIALTAIVAIVGAVAAAQAEAAAKAEAYADTLEAGSNRITKATRDMVKENLSVRSSFLWWEDMSALENAEALGISLGTVTKAAEGNAAAFKELKQIQHDYQQEVIKDRNAGDFNRDDDERLKKINAIINATKGEAKSIDEAIKSAELKQRADEQSADSAETVADAYITEADAVAELNSQLTDLMDRIMEANGVNQSAVTANAKYQAALAGISDEVEKQKRAYEEANGSLDGFTLSLDEQTVAGSANASMLTEVASAAENAAQKQFEVDLATMSAEDAALKWNGTLAAQRQAFVDSATAAGFNSDQVKALADRIFQMPGEKEIAMIVQTAQAQVAIDNFVNRNGNKTINVWLNPKTQAMNDAFSQYLQGHASGGPVVGPGTGTSDSIVRRLSNGEHVITAAEVAAAGGHAAIMRWRSGLMTGGAGLPQASGSPKIGAPVPALGDRMGFTQQQQSAPAQFEVVVSAKGGVDLLKYVDVRVQERGNRVASDLKHRRRADA